MTESSKAVFLSYAPQDAEAAARICAALRAAGIEVWFDQSELRGGDAWDYRIRQQVRDCALFIPIISAHTQARLEGYFRLEWGLAEQRTEMIARSKAFIVPVCVDGTRDSSAEVPDSFLKVQWTRLTNGETPARFCGRIKMLLGDPVVTAAAIDPVVPTPRAAPARPHWRWRTVAVATVLAAVGIALTYFLADGLWFTKASNTPAVAGNRIAAHSQALPLPDERSIAVLPFVNLGADPAQAFFADGVAEEILNLLANVPGLRVISRTSSFSFRGQHLDLQTIAHRLGVSYVVEGSVQAAGGRVQVTAQLIDVASDGHLWSQSYERKLDDVFAIQSDVAGQIAHSLKIAMGADEAATLGRRPTRDFAAWQLFLKAREQMVGRKSAEDLHGALAEIDAALERDPGFARAQSLRAMLLTALISWDQGNSAGGTEAARAVERQWDGALQAATHALQLDPGLGEPYAVRALHALAQNDFAEAGQNFKEALLRAPGNADAHNWYGEFLLSAGYLTKGLAEAQRATALDPLSPIIAMESAFAGMICNRPDVVGAYSARAREVGFSGPEPTAIRGGAALMRGQLKEAEELYLAAMPGNAAQIRMSFAAIRHRRIDAATRAMLATLVAYGPPGAGRFPVEAQVQDVDAMLATLYGSVAADSLVGAGRVWRAGAQLRKLRQGRCRRRPRRGLVDAACGRDASRSAVCAVRSRYRAGQVLACQRLARPLQAGRRRSRLQVADA